jgi:hypothetical protein
MKRTLTIMVPITVKVTGEAAATVKSAFDKVAPELKRLGVEASCKGAPRYPVVLLQSTNAQLTRRAIARSDC